MMDQTAGKEKFLQNSYPMKFFWLSCEPKGPTGVKICKQCIKSPVKTLFSSLALCCYNGAEVGVRYP